MDLVQFIVSLNITTMDISFHIFKSIVRPFLCAKRVIRYSILLVWGIVTSHCSPSEPFRTYSPLCTLLVRQLPPDCCANDKKFNRTPVSFAQYQVLEIFWFHVELISWLDNLYFFFLIECLVTQIIVTESAVLRGAKGVGHTGSWKCLQRLGCRKAERTPPVLKAIPSDSVKAIEDFIREV